MSDNRSHFVYRMFDSAGRLLYIGCTKDIVRRVRSHRSDNRHFFHRIYRISQQGPYPRGRALEIERRLIEELRPDFNSTADRRRRMAEKKRWTNARVRELSGGRLPQEMELNEYLRVADIAHQEASRVFPGINDSRSPHPVEKSPTRPRGGSKQGTAA